MGYGEDTILSGAKREVPDDELSSFVVEVPRAALLACGCVFPALCAELTMLLLRLRSVALYVALWTAATINATRHSFAVRHDSRRFIGPITPPFGFLVGGLYNITVVDFVATVHDPRTTSTSHHRKGVDTAPTAALDYVEAGFLLKRFTSQSAFETYSEKIYEKPSLCIYEPHRMSDFVSTDTTNTDDDLLSVDDDITWASHDFDSSKQIIIEPSSANGSVYLSMNQPELSWKPHSATISKSFDKKGDEGFVSILDYECAVLLH